MKKLLSQSWGANPSNLYTDYSYYDTEKKYNIGVMPSAIYDLSNPLSILLNGYADIYSIGKYEFREHFDSTNKSNTDISFSNTTYRATAAVCIDLSKNIELRVEGGYSMDNFNQKTDKLDYNGNSIYQSENNNHYTEVNSASAPDNDAVINAVGNGNPDNSYTNTVKVLTVLQWKVAPEVVLFSRAVLFPQAKTDKYNVFNTSDNSVWKEVKQSNSLNRELTIVAGITLSDNLFLGLQTDWLYGRTGSETDSLPASTGTVTKTAVERYSIKT